MTREPIPVNDETNVETLDAIPPSVSTSMRTPTPEFIERVCIAIKGGASPYVASEWAGVSRATSKRWMRTHDDLRAAVQQALAHVKVRLQSEIAKRSPEKALRHLHVREEQAEAGRLYTNGSGHTLVSKALPHLVERVTDASIPVADLSPIEQGARAWLDDVIADLGGTQNISATKMAVLRASVGSLILMSSIDHAIFQMASADGLVSRRYRKAFPIVEQRMRVADSLVRQPQSVGLDRTKNTPNDLTQYITEKYGTPASEPTEQEEDPK